VSNYHQLFRTLIIFGICIPLAIILGFLISDPYSVENDALVLLVLGLLMVPLILRWHHPFLILAWNLPAMVFFLPGKPAISMLACAISFTVSFLQYVLNPKLKFIQVPALTWPLLAMVAVAVVTAKLTGGLGVQATGGSSFGGKRYIFLFSAVLGYFALTARKIPLQKAVLYVRIFFLSQSAAAIGLLVSVVAPAFYFIFLIFPVDTGALQSVYGDNSGQNDPMLRLDSLAGTSFALFSALIAVHGIRGTLQLRKFWRPPIFLACFFLAGLAGYRGSIIMFMMLLTFQFCLEGLLRSKTLPFCLLSGLLCGAVILGYSDRLPRTAQRTLAFLPFLKIDPSVKMDADGSTNWRLEMWQRVWPEVPKHLLLGKGYSIDPRELEMANSTTMTLGRDPFEGALVAGDYHSGPLSVIIPFGIWGMAALLWFLAAAGKVLYRNYAYGDANLKNINTFLFSYFVAKVIFFFGVFGSLFSDFASFTGLVGLSVCLNGGVAERVLAPVAQQAQKALRFAGVRQRQVAH
jgi:O-Antigen ligase